MTTHTLIISNQLKPLKIITSLLDLMTVLWNYSISESTKRLNFNLYIKNKSSLWIFIHQNLILLSVVEIKSPFGISEQESLCLKDAIIKKLLPMSNLSHRVQGTLPLPLIIILKFSNQTHMKWLINKNSKLVL